MFVNFLREGIGFLFVLMRCYIIWINVFNEVNWKIWTKIFKNLFEDVEKLRRE